MIIDIPKSLENEFLKFKPFFSYCFTKDRTNRKFIEYNYKLKKISLKENLEFTKQFRQFQEKIRQETLKLSVLKEV